MKTIKDKEVSLESRWQEAKTLYRNGDKSGALFLYKSLVKDGELAAYTEVANIYEQPSGGGVAQDFFKAREWYKKTIDIANDVYGCIGLGRMFYYGKGGTRDFDQAFEYYSMDEDKLIPVVNLMLGRMYGLGHGVTKDYDKAKHYYRKAVNSGNVVALKDLGLLELELKNYWHGVYHWCLAILKIIFLAFRHRHDPRLRSQ
jgi:TPR repeat protein